MIFKEAELNLKRAYRGIAVEKNLMNYLDECHVIIPTLEKDQHLVAFKNGFIRLDTLQLRNMMI